MAKPKFTTTVKFKTEVPDGSSVLTYKVENGIIEVRAKDAHHFYKHPLFHLVPGEPIIEKPKDIPPTISPEEWEEGDPKSEKPEEEEEEKPKKKKKKATKKKKKKTEDE